MQRAAAVGMHTCVLQQASGLYAALINLHELICYHMQWKEHGNYGSVCYRRNNGESYREAVSGRSGRGEIQDTSGTKGHFLLQSPRPVRGQGKVSTGLNCGSRRKRQSTEDTDPLCADMEKVWPCKGAGFFCIMAGVTGGIVGGIAGNFDVKKC